MVWCKHNFYKPWETKNSVQLNLLQYSLYCSNLEPNFQYLQSTPVNIQVFMFGCWPLSSCGWILWHDLFVFNFFSCQCLSSLPSQHWQSLPLVLNWASLLLDFCYVKLRASVVAQCSKTHLYCRRQVISPWVEKILSRRKWPPTPVFLPGKSHGQRSLAGYSPWGRKESDMTEWLDRHTHTNTHVY